MVNPPWHNENRPQFKLSADQMAQLRAHAPNGMSDNQAAKWLLLKTLDPSAANTMQERADQGYTRLTT